LSFNHPVGLDVVVCVDASGLVAGGSLYMKQLVLVDNGWKPVASIE
jgi:hypothetical protein